MNTKQSSFSVSKQTTKRAAAAAIALGIAMGGVANNQAHAANTEGEDIQRGVAAGPLIVTPRLRLSAGWSSNVNLNAKTEMRADSPVFMVGPSVGLKLRESGMARFDTTLGVSWREYVGGEDGADAGSGLNANANLNLQLNHGGAVSFVLRDDLRLSQDEVYAPDLNDDPYEISFSDYGLDLGSGRVLTNVAHVGMKFHPGGDNEDSIGFAGEVNLKHTFNHYEQRPETDRHGIGANLRLGYRFLPKSVAFFEASGARTMYNELYGRAITQPVKAPYPGDYSLRNNDSTPVYAGIGLRTLVWPSIGIMTRIGYSTAFYDEGPNPGRLAFQLQGDAELSEHTKLRLGYSTNLADSTFGNYLTYHRVHASLSMNADPFRLTVSAFGQVNDYAKTPAVLATSGGVVIENYNTSERQDIPVGANAEFAVRASQSVNIGVQYSLLTNISNFNAEPLAHIWDEDTKESGDPNFVRHRVMLFVGLAL